MSAFNATKTLSAVLTALRSGETKLRELFALDQSHAEQIALAATATAATPAGYADIRLLLARMSWHAGVAGKAGNAPTWILRSSTAKGVTTIMVKPYVYNASKARGAADSAPAASSPAAPTPNADDATFNKPAPAPADTDVSPDAIIAALRDELERVRGQLAAECAAHEVTRAELATARQMLAAVPARPAKRAGLTAAQRRALAVPVQAQNL